MESKTSQFHKGNFSKVVILILVIVCLLLIGPQWVYGSDLKCLKIHFHFSWNSVHLPKYHLGMGYCVSLYMRVHFPHSSRSVQRLCPSTVISLKWGKGDIIVCCRLFHSRQSVSVWVSSSPVSALPYNTLLDFAPPFYSQCHQKADSRVWYSIIFSALWKCPHTYLQLPRAHTPTLLQHTLLPPCPLTPARWALS